MVFYHIWACHHNDTILFAYDHVSFYFCTLVSLIISFLMLPTWSIPMHSDFSSLSLLTFLYLCILDLFLKKIINTNLFLFMQSKPLLRPNHIHFSLSHFSLSNMLASYSFEQYHRFDMIISNETCSKTNQTHWSSNCFLIQPQKHTRKPICTFQSQFPRIYTSLHGLVGPWIVGCHPHSHIPRMQPMLNQCIRLLEIVCLRHYRSNRRLERVNASH